MPDDKKLTEILPITTTMGTAGQDYLITNHIVMSDADTEDRTIKVQVRPQ